MDVDELHCSNPECGEPLRRNKKNRYPKYCPECDLEVEIPAVLRQSTDILLQSTQGDNKPLTSTDTGFSPELQHITGRKDLEAAVTDAANPDHEREIATAEHSATVGPEQIDCEVPSDESPQPTEVGDKLTKSEVSEEARTCMTRTDDSLVPSSVDNVPACCSKDEKEAYTRQITTSQTIDSDNSTNNALISLPKSEMLVCPCCETDRKRSKKGNFSRYCRNCKHDFEAVGKCRPIIVVGLSH